ncbi:MAG TPA: Gfo/Idh/MocA family oxidoreductase [Verrucomicrobiae bacterium]|nr:Gfo/Idh/MocA family oxidoreductase [Verrucomicrobiae bacterium]
MNRKIRWGVLGYARIAREKVIPAICIAKNSEFHAIASRDEAKLAACRTQFQVPKTFKGYADLLRDPEVDAVYIPLPNSLHREWTMKAAEQGKHILCEKPMALNATECREMIAACKANGVTLMEAFMYRYTDRTNKVQEILRSEVLGEIKFVSSNFRFFLNRPGDVRLVRELGGGSLYDVGCYPVNFAGMVADEITETPGSAVPESVSAECVTIDGVDMLFSAILKYPSGLVASLNCGFNAHRRIFSEIVGTKGLLEIPDTFFDNAGKLMLTTDDVTREIDVAQCDRYKLEIEDFSDAILTKREPLFRLTETLRNMELMDRLFEAVN